MSTQINVNEEYLVKFNTNGIFVNSGFGATPPTQELYTDMADLPLWVKRKLSLLCMLDVGGSIEDVGLRASPTFYLLYKTPEDYASYQGDTQWLQHPKQKLRKKWWKSLKGLAHTISTR